MRKFCVIGQTCGRTASGESRRWFDTEEEAVGHAHELLEGRQPGSPPAFVVEVRRVVQIEAHPIRVRGPEASDFEPMPDSPGLRKNGY